MKVLIFTEGTILMHANARDIPRKERVKQSKLAGIQREERNLNYSANTILPVVKPGSVYDFNNYIPIANSVAKLTRWKKQGATIYYLTSRRIKTEIETIKNILNKYNFPDDSNLYFRQPRQDYKDIAEKLIPDVLIEDDCESIGGEKEMIYPHVRREIKEKIKSIIVKEFEGVDRLPNYIQFL